MTYVARVVEVREDGQTPASPEAIRSCSPESFSPVSVAGPAPVGEQALERIERAAAARIGRDRYDQWVDGKTRIGLSAAGVTIAAANAFAANWIRSKFADDFRAAAAEVLGRPVDVVVSVDATLQAAPQAATAGPAATEDAAARATPAPLAPAPRRESAPVINARHTFEEFVVGPSNQLAYHAAIRAAEAPGQQFSPLFIHGLCGMGKTHLLQAICHRFSTLYPTKKWLYLTGEGFTNEFLDAIRHNRTEAFRRRVRGADLLIIDDVHFLANKKATQEEFLHTLNQVAATGNGRQIVLASDCAPRAINAMADALTSRFVSGMVVRVDAPDLPTRVEIARRRAARNRWPLSEAVIMHVAQQSAGSVRELEGTLLQVVAGMTLLASPAGADPAGAATVLATLKDRSAPAHGPVAVGRIVAAVAAHFGVEESALLGSAREKTLATARAVAMHLARKHTGMSFPEIGRAMGNKNHSTVIAACQRVETFLVSGELICWTHKVDKVARHQVMSDLLHELETALRRKG